MTATDPTTEQTARLPTDYIGGTCERRRASTSIPNQTRGERVKEGLSETVIFRCTVAEKAALVAKADAAGLPNATLMREALGLVQARRRKPVPRVDPLLTVAVARVGGNLNQLSRWINGAVNRAFTAQTRQEARCAYENPARHGYQGGNARDADAGQQNA